MRSKLYFKRVHEKYLSLCDGYLNIPNKYIVVVAPDLNVDKEFFWKKIEKFVRKYEIDSLLLIADKKLLDSFEVDSIFEDIVTSIIVETKEIYDYLRLYSLMPLGANAMFVSKNVAGRQLTDLMSDFEIVDIMFK